MLRDWSIKFGTESFKDEWNEKAVCFLLPELSGLL